MSKNILVVAGARPNFMKAAPVLRALHGHPDAFKVTFVHSGQHYDKNMSEIFIRELGIPEPDIFFHLQHTTHSGKIAEIIRRCFDLIQETKPAIVLVFGDVNTTIAAGLAALKKQVSVAHVEAGLRSFDRRMPEELNRVLTDHISDYLFVSEQSGVDNLLSEGVHADHIHFVGNVMVDTLCALLPTIRGRAKELCPPQDKPHIIVTLHRQENVDDPRILRLLVDNVHQLTQQYRVVWPLHPRTRSMIDACHYTSFLDGMQILDPLGYIDFMAYVSTAAAVVTDSGGVQEETTYLGIPCFTLRDSTERPCTVEIGSNTLLPPQSLTEKPLLHHLAVSVSHDYKIPQYWDGHAAERIIEILL